MNVRSVIHGGSVRFPGWPRRTAPEVPEAFGVPPEFLLQRDQTLRYKRGGSVYATDGKVGVLERVVVDEGAGAITDLVVRLHLGGRRVVVPADLVAMTAGGGVFLRESRDSFSKRAADAPGYDKRRYTRVDLRTLVMHGGRGGRDPRRQVAIAGRNFIETPSVVPAEHLERRGITRIEALS